MMQRHYLGAVRTCAAAAGLLLVAYAAHAETFTATASVKTAAGVSGSAPVTIVINHFASDAEREALGAAVRKGGTPAARELVQGWTDAGSLQIGARTTAIKYAYARAMGSGRLISIMTAEPVLYLGAGMPEAKPTAEYQVALALFEVNPTGPGQGELAPAAKVKLDDQNAVVTEDYGAEVVRLTNVVKK